VLVLPPDVDRAGRFGLKVVHWELIEDYELDNPSWKYRCFVRFVSWFRWLIPGRLRANAMLFILEKGEPPAMPSSTADQRKMPRPEISRSG